MIYPASRRPNTYTGNPLDRADRLRGDPDWVSARLVDPDSQFLPLWRGRSLVGADGAVRLQGGERALDHPDAPWVLLGLQDGRAVFAIDLSAVDEPSASLPVGTVFEDLRRIGPELSANEASILAHARALVHWRQRSGFCPICGALTKPLRAGLVVGCLGCGAHHFPRTDPAVIMAVTNGERILLARSARWANTTMVSTLAGFVEPGESLEEAVAREVFEEVGVRVRDVAYHSSQPWPFPASIMLGFYATAQGEAIHIDQAEIVEARWFDRASLADPEAHGFKLPGSDSIARRLIEDWIET